MGGTNKFFRAVFVLYRSQVGLRNFKVNWGLGNDSDVIFSSKRVTKRGVSYGKSATTKSCRAVQSK